MFLINLKKVKKHYLDIYFNLNINKGDLIVISGTNGTGKSTLVKLIVGFIKPDEGLITKKTKKITYLSEHQALPESIEVKKYLTTIERIRKGTYNKMLFEQFDIPYNKKIFELSKGNKQKLAIVATIIGNNDLYVFDEPLSGLDTRSTLVFKNLIQSMISLKKSVVISTHKPKTFDDFVKTKVVL